MAGSRSDLLFYGKKLGALIQAFETEIRNEVEAWERNKVLGASESDLVDYLVEKYTLDPPHLLRDQRYIDREGEAQIDVSRRLEYDVRNRGRPFDVPGSYVTVAIPFEGDANLFGYQASAWSNPPRARVEGSRLLITFQDVELDPERVRQEIDSLATRIEEYLKWTKKDCDAWNASVESVAKHCVADRKRRLLDQANMVSALGLPMKRRPDAVTAISVPVSRKKRPIVLPSTPREAFKPEPALPDAEYDFILSTIERLAQSIERSPSTFAHMKEEQIRDLILVNLNGHYEGNATGETFNANGKTDILIRAEGRNAFIGECKYWEGPKGFHAAIDQILGYLTWRDTKAALLIFSKNADFTNVLGSISNAVPKHSNFKKELRRVSDTHVRYLFQQKDDPAREIHLAVLAFNIPKMS